MDTQLATLRRTVEAELRPFGPYFTMKDALPGEQRFSFAHAELIVLSLLAWAFGTYVKAYLEELGKTHAKQGSSTPDDVKERLQELEAQLQRLMLQSEAARSDSELSKSIEELRKTGLPIGVVMLDRHQLQARLQLDGLTERAATTVAAKLVPVLEAGVTDILRNKSQ